MSTDFGIIFMLKIKVFSDTVRLLCKSSKFRLYFLTY